MRRAWHLSIQRDVGVFILLVGLSITIATLDRLGNDGVIAGQLARIFIPFENLAETVMNLSFVHKENHYLRSRLVDMEMENARLLEQVHESARLRDLFGFSEGRRDTLCCSRVASILGERMGSGIVIDKGKASGLAKNMTVIGPRGLVGRILRVGRGAAQVKRVIDPGYRVSALVRKSRATGILGAGTDGRLVMEWVAPDASVAVGDTVMSSGLGSITPKGIPIGRVSGVTARLEKFSLALEVEPFVDFDRLEEVFVILRVPPRYGDILEPVQD